jgi:uncharacterized protein (TIGR00661 family)
MARIAYALTDQGRGHSSRVSAIADDLEARGHSLLFVCGGNAGSLMRAAGRQVVDVPVLRHLMRDNEIRLWTSLAGMGVQQLRTLGTVSRVAESLAAFGPDLLVSDFESYSVRAAARLGIPVVAFNHQQILTHTRFDVPPRYRFDAWVARLVVRTASPSRAVHVIVSSFYFPPLVDPKHTTLVGPILRKAILEAEPSDGDEILVYHNDPTGFSRFLEVLRAVEEAKFVVYNFEPTPALRDAPNLRFERPNTEGFVRDLARARAVISSAGYTLMCEAIHLAKPQLAMPNGGIFEQTLNALYLERMGLGRAMVGSEITPDDVRGFLARHAGYADKLRSTRLAPGNDAAVAKIEALAIAARGGRFASDAAR